MLLQENLSFEFKKSGTLNVFGGEFGIGRLRLNEEIEKKGKEENEKGNKRIFLFGNRF